MESDHALETSDDKKSRSCIVNLVIAFVLLLLGLAVFSYKRIAVNAEEQALAGRKFSREDLEQWLTSPADLPPDFYTVIPESKNQKILTAFQNLDLQITDVLQKSIHCYYSEEWLTAPLNSKPPRSPYPLENLQKGTELSDQETSSLQALTDALQRLAPALENLTANDNYSRYSPGFLISGSEGRMLTLKQSYAECSLYPAKTGNMKDAIRLLKVSLLLNNIASRYAQGSNGMDIYMDTLRQLTNVTTNTEELKQIDALADMVQSRYDNVMKYPFLNTLLPLLAWQMKKDGYIHNVPRTHGEYIGLLFKADDFFSWIDNNKVYKLSNADRKLREIIQPESRFYRSPGWLLQHLSPEFRQKAFYSAYLFCEGAHLYNAFQSYQNIYTDSRYRFQKVREEIKNKLKTVNGQP